LLDRFIAEDPKDYTEKALRDEREDQVDNVARQGCVHHVGIENVNSIENCKDCRAQEEEAK